MCSVCCVVICGVLFVMRCWMVCDYVSCVVICGVLFVMMCGDMWCVVCDEMLDGV